MKTDPVRKMYDCGYEFQARKGPFLLLLENKYSGSFMLLNTNTGRYTMLDRE